MVLRWQRLANFQGRYKITLSSPGLTPQELDKNSEQSDLLHRVPRAARDTQWTALIHAQTAPGESVVLSGPVTTSGEVCVPRSGSTRCGQSVSPVPASSAPPDAEVSGLGLRLYGDPYNVVDVSFTSHDSFIRHE